MTETSTDAETTLEAPPDDQYHDETDDAPPTADSDDGLDPRSATIRRYLVWGGLAVCSVVAVVALVRFYGSVTDAIDLWVDPKYRPLVHAAFNLTLLLTSLIGVSVLVRELSDRY
ncbi:hypothetical protein C488_10468 [Natrinema pellirubrum DSM 15624]|uniref:DUF8060 domain-containing protein n=1 Tax=Natrinema pellirubrum (strain DSM 15624 / CIP 106293 / JCM 10476 / NCIMB 786 / 157) TaxID=797303 RepID=L0JGJ3_NATP1|nr:hypothetical protein [Natrinema pellirubrum]AGB30655.1 hypothetical protein Natpe_0733 [Natrinema pellirubrum DSM 15624]ELY74869.1 hypothetical protein C488_10468 [Natrinema pellirubrum DSM 15624]